MYSASLRYLSRTGGFGSYIEETRGPRAGGGDVEFFPRGLV